MLPGHDALPTREGLLRQMLRAFRRSEAVVRAAITAAKSGANADITALSALSTALTIAQGGTNATTAAGARAAFGCNDFAITYNENATRIVSATYTAVGSSISYVNSGSSYASGVFTAPGTGFVRCRIANVTVQTASGTPSTLDMKVAVNGAVTGLAPQQAYSNATVVSQGNFEEVFACAPGFTYQWFARLSGVAASQSFCNWSGLSYEFIPG